jgi:hypothetical protein
LGRALPLAARCEQATQEHNRRRPTPIFARLAEPPRVSRRLGGVCLARVG